MPTPNSATSQVKQLWLTAIAALVAGLATVATAGGILTAFGHAHRNFLSLSGEKVSIQGGGLYAHESVSMAAQGVGMDLVTLLVGVPALLLVSYLAARGSVRGKLLRIGVFWYFTYSYLVILFGVTFNAFFLIYVALFSASLLGLILSILSMDTAGLPAHFSSRFARRTVAWVVMGVSVMFALLWLSRILPALISGTPPVGLESYTTLSVQAADLGVVIPMSILASLLLLRRQAVGYLLIFPAVLFLATIGLALVAMVIAMAAMGTAIGPADFIPAVITAVLGLALSVHLVLSVEPKWASRSVHGSDVAGQRSVLTDAH
jgi:hypothetical protein